MARVPSYGVPQMQARVTPNVRIDDSGANEMRRAGAAIAGGMQDVARVTAGIAQQEAEKVNTTRLMQAEQQLNAIDAELLNSEKGAFAQTLGNAQNLPDRVLPEWDKRASVVLDGLPAHLKEKFGQFVAHRRRDNEKALVRHSVKQADDYRAMVAVSTEQSFTEDAARNWQNLERVHESLGKAAMARAERLSEMGAPPVAIDLATREVYSKGHRAVIERLLAEDPNAAQERLDAAQEFMLASDVAAVEDNLAPIFEDREYESIASAVMSGASTVAVVPSQRGKPSQAVVNAIEAAAQKHGVPAEYLYALAEQESGFNPKAYNGEHGASGIMQYIPGTAADRGIDPYDVNQAIDAAAKDFAERMQAGGVDEAIMSHFAGPGGGNRGPKTERYLAEVKGRAQRWAGATVEPQAVPSTLGAALAQVKVDPRASNPRWLKGAQAAVTRAWSVKERDEADRDSALLESMRARVDAAPPGTSAAKAVGADWGVAVRKGWTGSLEAIANAKASGVLIETNAVTYDEFARLAVTNPSEFAKPQTRLEIMKASGELGTADLKRLLTDWQSLNDPAKRTQTIADHQTETQRMAMGLRIAGIVGDKAKAKVNPEDKNSPTQAQAFGAFYRQARQAAIANADGRKLTPQEEDALARNVAQQWTADPLQGRKALSAERLGVVPADAEAVRQALIAEGNANPTPDEVQAELAAIYRKREKAQ